jgi:hypothetical protein
MKALMKTFKFFLIVAVMFAAIFGYTQPGRAQQEMPEGIPTLKIVEYRATPQWGQLQVINAGDLRLELNPAGHSIQEFRSDAGTWLYFKDMYGHLYDIVSNVWVAQPDGTFVTEMYVASWHEAMWIPSAGLAVSYEGLGPWEPSLYEGHLAFTKPEKTQIELTLADPEFKSWDGIGNPTWDWKLSASPAWAVEQYAQTGEVIVKVDTTCNGFGDNHEGNFVWKARLGDGIVFGNGVPREYIRENLAPAKWSMQRPDGTVLLEGDTLAPTCSVRGHMFLPIVIK